MVVVVVVTESGAVPGDGTATARVVAGWLDRCPTWARDLIVGPGALLVASLAMLARDWMVTGEVPSGPVAWSAVTAAVVGVGQWCWLTWTRATTCYGAGSGG